MLAESLGEGTSLGRAVRGMTRGEDRVVRSCAKTGKAYVSMGPEELGPTSGRFAESPQGGSSGHEVRSGPDAGNEPTDGGLGMAESVDGNWNGFYQGSRKLDWAEIGVVEEAEVVKRI